MKGSDLSRRSFLKRSAAAGALPVQIAAAQPPPAGIAINAPHPAGAAPAGAPVETAIPFAKGKLHWPANFVVRASNGDPVLSQLRPASQWPDGSVRWLQVVFEPDTGAGDYFLAGGSGPQAAGLVREDSQRITLDSGEARIHIRRDGWVEEIVAPGPEGSLVPLISGESPCDLVITRRDGTVFSASGGTPRAVIEERGPVRGSIRLEGRTRAAGGGELFDYILRLTVYRARPEVHLSVTWINTTPNLSEQVRDIRVAFPFGWQPANLAMGCEHGIYDGPFVKGWPVWLVQEDQDRYWARTKNVDGRIQNLATGGANGERAPGWMLIANSQRALGLQVDDFWQRYPNEIAVQDGLLSVGLWPERANAHLKTKPLLPADPFHDKPYSNTKYWPVMPHPYTAFVAPQDGCLDARQGVAMTQEIVIGLWAGRVPSPLFERKQRAGAFKAARGHLEAGYVAATQALGPMAPSDPVRFAALEQIFSESFGWLDRHIDRQKCYGKFDYGDFRYFTAGTDYVITPDSKWGEMGEMAREGYWHNNERDPLRGLILYYFRTGDSAAWERCRLAARHALDVDLRHSPHWGMWTHSYGHCYLGLGEGGEPDHSWLLGLLHWAGLSGDPVAADWVRRCGERLAGLRIDFEQTDARTAAVFLHMMCHFYLHTGSTAYLDAAQPAVAAFRKIQNPNGSWPAYLANLKQPRIEGFVEHAVMALSDYFAIRSEPGVRQAVDRALVYLFGEDGDGKVDTGESGLAVYGLAIMASATGEDRYAATALRVLQKLRNHLNLSPDPLGRGDLWAEWGPNKSATPGSAGRPAQLLGQTRPLAPATMLSYAQPAMAVIKAEQPR
ncbi:MAG: twin-arginine translocation signal domain-containing protein [Bryobacteraceae bacterium]